MGKKKECLLANGLIIRVATVHIICDLFLVALTCKVSAFSGFLNSGGLTRALL